MAGGGVWSLIQEFSCDGAVRFRSFTVGTEFSFRILGFSSPLSVCVNVGLTLDWEDLSVLQAEGKAE